MLIWAHARKLALSPQSYRLTADFLGPEHPTTLMRFDVGCCAMAAPTPEINFDDPGPGRGAGPSGLAVLGTTELAGLRRRSTQGLNWSGRRIRVSEGSGSRPQMHGSALPIRRGRRGCGNRPSRVGRGLRTRYLALGESLDTVRITLLIIADLLEGRKMCICLNERAATDLKIGKVALVLISMILGGKTLMRQPVVEGMAIFAAMCGWREEKV
jgi:hypothetical protein